MEYLDMTLETIKQHIRLYSAFGYISDRDMDRLIAEADRSGISREELQLLIKSVDMDRKTDTQSDTFVPKPIHFVIAALMIALLSVFIYFTLAPDSDEQKPVSLYKGLSSAPVTEFDLKNLYSGSYSGKSVLVTVKEVRRDNDKVVMICDIKCDFRSIATGVRCHVDLGKRTYSFQENEAVTREIPLAEGSISRSVSGKILLTGSNRAYELTQL